MPDEFYDGVPDAKAFDALMAHVSCRFNVLPLSEAAIRLRAGDLPPRSVSVTFDDGYADNLAVAAPILKRHQIPATLFIATAFVNGGCMWNDMVTEACRQTAKKVLNLDPIGLGSHTVGDVTDRRRLASRLVTLLKYEDTSRRAQLAEAIAEMAEIAVPSNLMLSSQDLPKLDAYGIEIGAHTRSHPILARMAVADAQVEIVEGKKELEAWTGRSVDTFAYPNGKPGADYTIDHVAMVRTAGFSAAVSTAWGAATGRSDVFQLPRFTPWHMTPFRFDLLMLRNLGVPSEQCVA